MEESRLALAHPGRNSPARLIISESIEQCCRRDILAACINGRVPPVETGFIRDFKCARARVSQRRDIYARRDSLAALSVDAERICTLPLPPPLVALSISFSVLKCYDRRTPSYVSVTPERATAISLVARRKEAAPVVVHSDLLV